MPQSLSSVLLHITFSTKRRRPFLKRPEHRDVMTGYLAGTLRNLRCPSLIVGVVEDHVHILCNLARTITIAKLVEEVKSSASGRIQQEGPTLERFYWQNGYGVFSVSQSILAIVKLEQRATAHPSPGFRVCLAKMTRAGCSPLAATNPARVLRFCPGPRGPVSPRQFEPLVDKAPFPLTSDF